MPLLEFTEKGIYCKQAKVYIDPWRKVDRAIITHGHSDHARKGHKNYLCHKDSVAILKHRLGEGIKVEGIEYGVAQTINGVKFSLHPAGHIIGSAQVRVEYKGEVWVASGDYKIDNDNLSTPFEPVKCDVFITESTFGLPVYNWPDPKEEFEQINKWWRQNQELGKCTVLTGYALGKAQRLLQNIDHNIGPVYTHGAVEQMNEVLRNAGIALKPTTLVTPDIDKKEYRNALILTTSSGTGSSWIKKFHPYSIGAASGWMALRGARRRSSVDRGFIISDHADWHGLNTAIKETGCSKVIVTHGYTDIFARWLNDLGIEAVTEKTQFEGELAEISKTEKEEEQA